MQRFTVKIALRANVAVQAPSPEAAALCISGLLSRVDIAKLADEDFVVEETTMIEVLDVNWRPVWPEAEKG